MGSIQHGCVLLVGTAWCRQPYDDTDWAPTMTRDDRDDRTGHGRRAKAVLVTLAAAQFVMILDSSVMNVSIATVAKDLGTTVTGIQTAITMYTLVMASLMITGGKMGAILGRKRAFTIGCVIYACGSLTTALSPNLAVLLFGWSFLEGVGAALVMPAIVALVASNFVKAERPRAYGIVMAGGAIAVGGRPADRRAVHHLLVVALRVRRRGAHHRRGPAPQPAHRRHPEGGGRPPRPRRHRALGARARA